MPKIAKIIGIAGIAFLTFTIGIFLFYWYQLRPARIKHDCSWVKIIEKAQPAQPAMTEEELKARGWIKDCPITKSIPSSVWTLEEALGDACREDNERIIRKYKIARKAIPERISWRKAAENEYKFCLHDKGL